MHTLIMGLQLTHIFMIIIECKKLAKKISWWRDLAFTKALQRLNKRKRKDNNRGEWLIMKSSYQDEIYVNGITLYIFLYYFSSLFTSSYTILCWRKCSCKSPLAFSGSVCVPVIYECILLRMDFFGLRYTLKSNDRIVHWNCPWKMIKPEAQDSFACL